jgi:hypothetical protein
MASLEVASMSVDQVVAWLEAVHLRDFCDYVSTTVDEKREKEKRANLSLPLLSLSLFSLSLFTESLVYLARIYASLSIFLFLSIYGLT